MIEGFGKHLRSIRCCRFLARLCKFRGQTVRYIFHYKTQLIFLPAVEIKQFCWFFFFGFIFGFCNFVGNLISIHSCCWWSSSWEEKVVWTCSLKRKKAHSLATATPNSKPKRRVYTINFKPQNNFLNLACFFLVFFFSPSPALFWFLFVDGVAVNVITLLLNDET